MTNTARVKNKKILLVQTQVIFLVKDNKSHYTIMMNRKLEEGLERFYLLF